MDVRCQLRSEAYPQEGDDDDDDDDERGYMSMEGWGGVKGRGATDVADEDWDMVDAFPSDHDENETIGTQRRRSGK